MPLLRPSIWNIIFTISCLLWRSAARVVRAQVLSLKQRAFVRATIVAGASDWRVLYLHILPNVLPIALLYVAPPFAFYCLALPAALRLPGRRRPQAPLWKR